MCVCVCVCACVRVFLFLCWWERRQGMKLTGCDGRQFMLLCLNCHLMCMQSGTLTKKDTSSRRTTEMGCEDKQVWSDQTHSEVDLTNLGLVTKSDWAVCLWLNAHKTLYLSPKSSYINRVPPTQQVHDICDTHLHHTHTHTHTHKYLHPHTHKSWCRVQLSCFNRNHHSTNDFSL